MFTEAEYSVCIECDRINEYTKKVTKLSSVRRNVWARSPDEAKRRALAFYPKSVNPTVMWIRVEREGSSRWS